MSTQEAQLGFVLAGQGQLIFADANTSIAAGTDAEVTSYMLEDGSDASDHIKLSPPTLSLELVQSNKPTPSFEQDSSTRYISLGTMAQTETEFDGTRQSQFQAKGFLFLTQQAGALLSAAADLVGFGGGGDSIKYNVWRLNDKFDRIVKLYDVLLEAQAAKTLFIVTAGNKTYFDYALTSLSYARTGPDQFATFQLSMKKVRKAPPASLALGSLPDPNELLLKAAAAAKRALLKREKGSAEAIKKKHFDKGTLLSNAVDGAAAGFK